MDRPTSAVATLVLPLFVAAAVPSQALADEGPLTHLTGKDIRTKVIGKVVTDGAHWSDYFEKGGALVSWSQGRKSTGKWEIRGEELCIAEEANETPTCYQVWLNGEEISLRLDGVDTTFTGYLRKHPPE